MASKRNTPSFSENSKAWRPLRSFPCVFVCKRRPSDKSKGLLREERLAWKGWMQDACGPAEGQSRNRLRRMNTWCQHPDYVSPYSPGGQTQSNTYIIWWGFTGLEAGWAYYGHVHARQPWKSGIAEFKTFKAPEQEGSMTQPQSKAKCQIQALEHPHWKAKESGYHS